MLLATWNINGIRARIDRLKEWLELRRPDVLCLQELKIEDAKFPHLEFEAMGYRAEVFGQKAFNGVAILSRVPLRDVQRGFGHGVEFEQARVLMATTQDNIRVVSAYFPNGQKVGCDKYVFKLDWMKRLRDYLAEHVQPGTQWALCGDLNVAPADIDVHDPAAWRDHVLCSAAEREALERISEVGLVDVVRHLHPDREMFTWWDYRVLAFPKNLGLRIDHVLVTPSLAKRVVGAEVDREARKGKLPSDHAPLMITIEDAPAGVVDA